LKTHIETTEITGTPSAVSLDNVFSADYKRYRIIMELVPSGAAQNSIRLRAAGTDNSGGTSYISTYTRNDAGSVNSVEAISSAFNFNNANRRETFFDFVIFNPFISVNTYINGGLSYFNTTNDNGNTKFGGKHTVSSSYDGFSIIISTGTYTSGTISVFGIKD
jgi:hypothetical protein